jgi:hypothetical protein
MRPAPATGKSASVDCGASGLKDPGEISINRPFVKQRGACIGVSLRS